MPILPFFTSELEEELGTSGSLTKSGFSSGFSSGFGIKKHATREHGVAFYTKSTNNFVYWKTKNTEDTWETTESSLAVDDQPSYMECYPNPADPNHCYLVLQMTSVSTEIYSYRFRENTLTLVKSLSGAYNPSEDQKHFCGSFSGKGHFVIIWSEDAATLRYSYIRNHDNVVTGWKDGQPPGGPSAELLCAQAPFRVKGEISPFAYITRKTGANTARAVIWDHDAQAWIDDEDLGTAAQELSKNRMIGCAEDNYHAPREFVVVWAEDNGASSAIKYKVYDIDSSAWGSTGTISGLTITATSEFTIHCCESSPHDRRVFAFVLDFLTGDLDFSKYENGSWVPWIEVKNSGGGSTYQEFYAMPDSRSGKRVVVYRDVSGSSGLRTRFIETDLSLSIESGFDGDDGDNTGGHCFIFDTRSGLGNQGLMAATCRGTGRAEPGTTVWVSTHTNGIGGPVWGSATVLDSTGPNTDSNVVKIACCFQEAQAGQNVRVSLLEIVVPSGTPNLVKVSSGSIPASIVDYPTAVIRAAFEAGTGSGTPTVKATLREGSEEASFSNADATATTPSETPALQNDLVLIDPDVEVSIQIEVGGAKTAASAFAELWGLLPLSQHSSRPRRRDFVYDVSKTDSVIDLAKPGRTEY